MLLTFKRPGRTFLQVEDLMRMVQPHSLLDARLYRILCIGNDRELLCSRCAVLATEGYHTQWTSPLHARKNLEGGPFDLVILCSTLNTRETEWVRACIPRGPKILAMNHILFPDTLVCIIGHLLQGSRIAP
jgi:hypothetical protein